MSSRAKVEMKSVEIVAENKRQHLGDSLGSGGRATFSYRRKKVKYLIKIFKNKSVHFWQQSWQQWGKVPVGKGVHKKNIQQNTRTHSESLRHSKQTN